MNIDVLLYDGFDELDGIGPYEIFDYAIGYAAEPDTTDTDTDTTEPDTTDDGAAAEGRLRYVTLDDRDQVTASHGTRVGVDDVLPDPTNASAPDLLVVPGGGWNARDPNASAWAEAQKGDIPAALLDYHETGVRLASVCTGSMLLAEAGITDGRRAVTHAGAIDELRESGANVIDARVVDDGDLLTAGGITSGLDLALYIVEQEFGADIADQVATVTEYERRFDVARAQ